MCHPVGCRSLLAFLGLLSSLLSFIAAYGFCSYLGFQVTSIHNLLPFLLLGIGADDMYVLTTVADQLNPQNSVRHRVSFTMGVAGVSILLTSITDCVAFLASSFSSLPALSSFCFFAAMGVLFDFFFQITFFSAFLAIDLKRQKNNKPDCLGLCSCRAKSFFFCGGRCLPPDTIDPSKPHETP